MRRCLFILLALILGFGLETQAAETWRPVWRADASSEFEVGTQLRPWTIRDEGLDYILDNVQSMAGVNNIYLIVVMHEEHRPFQAPEFPHNPVRDTFQAEDSTVAFFPDMKRYGKIKPVLSGYDWIRDTDWLELVVDACRARGLGVGAEVSHFPIPKALVRANPDWQQRTIDGKPDTVKFCPNNPETREYVIALFTDIAANYDVDYVQTCQWLFNDKDIDEGGTCFCRYCIAEAKRTGFDLEAAIPVLTKNKNAQPERDKWQKLRRDSSTRLYRDICESIKEVNPKCHVRLNDVYTWGGRDTIRFGLDLEAVAPYLGSVVNQDHQEQLGRADETFELRERWLRTNRNLIGQDMPLLSGIATRMKASPELIRAGIKVALESPARVNGLAMKHYDGASFSLMRAFKQGMIEAGVQGLTPTIGKEVEEMELDGYEPFTEELVEEWGVQTKGEGRASHVFDEPSGSYDIRITYFDEEGGRSPVTLLVAGQERATFRMDEDTDCWRWRKFENIRVKKGDTITLVGKADRKELARIDYIEFIKPDSSLCDTYKGRFDLAVALDGRLPDDYSAKELNLIRKQFSVLTPANCMKMYHTQRRNGVFDFEQADAFVAFAEANKQKVLGHCLIWAKDERTPRWFFENGGYPPTRELLLERMQTHIETVVGRYRGKVPYWDVLNESLADDENFIRPSTYLSVIGEDYIAKAFEYAHAADPEAMLIYNDYNLFFANKQKKLRQLLEYFKERKVPVHAIGIQGHFELDKIPYDDLEATIELIKSFGLKMVVSELDIDVVLRSKWWAEDGKYREELAKYDPYNPDCPPEILRQQAEEYTKLFALFSKHADSIQRITFWGLHDGQSWLNDFPWKRVNHPLLFDRNAEPKRAYEAVLSVK